jgi:hypothetical protein
MSRKTKITELQNEDGTIVIEKDVQPEIPTISTTAVKAKVKREMTEAQRLNMLKMIEANKVKWEAKRKAKEEEEVKAKADKRAKEEELIKAGTHIRVKVQPKRVYKPRAKPIQEEETATEEEDEESDTGSFQAVPQVKRRSQKAPPPSDEETTETETDDDYKNQKRVVRREVKKNLKALKKIDEVLEQSQGNPYLAYLTQRWK